MRARSSIRARRDRGVCASPRPPAPSRASAVPLAFVAFPATLLLSRRGPSRSSPENPERVAPKNDEIAAPRLEKQRAQSQSVGRYAKYGKKADRIAALRDHANAK